MTIGGDKRKMKTQIVAILAIIAVITALITVSAFSNEEGYNVTPCDAIDISIENSTVTDFLNATNMTTVQVYNFKGYKGENTWMVQWSSSNRSLEVYVNVATGCIAGIEKITVPEALKAWIVANYGDGTRVTSDSAYKLNMALALNTLAPLPAGYTKADITQDVYKWARDNVGWKPSTTTPPVTPTGPPDAIKAWVVANYGDGTRVTSDGWRKLSDAEMANTLAPLPAGYTKADITDEVYTWAMDNPNYTVSGTTPTPTPTVEVPETICGWINSIGVTNLTEDHGFYVYSLATNWTVVADSIYDMLSPKPSRLPAALATEDNGRAVYYYAIGSNTIADEITGCNFWTTPTRRLIDTVEIGVEIVGPTPTPSVTPTEPPDAIKAWIVANYGRGTQVSGLGWLKLSGARNSGTLAPLPVGYTSADITQEVVTWAKNNPNYTISGAAPTPTPSVTPTPTPETKTWHTVTTFQGRHDRKTPVFNIKGDEWRIILETVGHENDSSIQVTVYKDFGSWTTFVDVFYGNNFPFSDTRYEYDGPGPYCLDIIADDLEYWSISVEDFY